MYTAQQSGILCSKKAITSTGEMHVGPCDCSKMFQKAKAKLYTLKLALTAIGATKIPNVYIRVCNKSIQ